MFSSVFQIATVLSERVAASISFLLLQLFDNNDRPSVM